MAPPRKLGKGAAGAAPTGGGTASPGKATSETHGPGQGPRERRPRFPCGQLILATQLFAVTGQTAHTHAVRSPTPSANFKICRRFPRGSPLDASSH